MTVLRVLAFSLVYLICCLAAGNLVQNKKFNSEREQEIMKHFVKGTIVVAGVMIVLLVVNIIINIVCNKNGIELNSTAMNMVFTFIGVFSGISIYDRWIQNEK